MSVQHPLVSICIPVYNNARYLRQCLDSIAGQTYKNIEVIIGDDGSTDESPRIAEEYHERSGYRIYRSPKNGGAAAMSSALVHMARGTYVAVYHSDDQYEANIVEESVNALQSDDSIGLVGTLANIIDEQGNLQGEFRLHEALKSSVNRKYDFDETMLGVLKNGGTDIILVTPSVMTRKRIYQEVGLFNTDKYRSAYDYEMWLRIATRYPIVIIDKKLMSYRIHQNQVSELQIRKNPEIQDIVWVIRDYRPSIASENLRKYCDRLLDTWLFRTAKKQNYRRMFSKSSETLQFIESKRYCILNLLLKTLNRLQISLKRTKVS